MRVVGRCRSLLPDHNCTDMQPGADQQTIPMLLTTIGREQHCNNRLTIRRLKHDLLKGVVAQRNEKHTNSNPIPRLNLLQEQNAP